MGNVCIPPPEGPEAPSKPLRHRNRKGSFAVASLRRVETNFSPIGHAQPQSKKQQEQNHENQPQQQQKHREAAPPRKEPSERKSNKPRRYKSFPEAETVVRYYENENELYKRTGEVDSLDMSNSQRRRGAKDHFRRREDDCLSVSLKNHDRITGSLNYKTQTLLGGSWTRASVELVAGELRVYSDQAMSPSARITTIHLHNARVVKVSPEQTRALKLKKSASGRARDMLVSSFSSRRGDTNDPRYTCRFEVRTADDATVHTMHASEHDACQEWIAAIGEEIKFVNERKMALARKAVEAARRKRRTSMVATRTAILEEVHETDKLNAEREEGKDNAKEGNEHTRILKAIVGNHFLFRSFDEHSIQQLVSSAMPQKFKAGETIISQGDIGSKLYMLESGSVRFLKDGVEVQLIGEGKLFGELALLYDAPRAVSAVAVEDCIVWSVHRVWFKTIMKRVEETSIEEREAVLSSVHLLQHISTDGRRLLARALTLKKFKKGDAVISQGESGDHFYIIKTGEVEVTKTLHGSAKSQRVFGKALSTQHKLTKLSKGDYFGEMALLNAAKRNATIVVASPTAEFFVLGRHDFESLLGPLRDFLSHHTAIMTLKSIKIFESLDEKTLESIARTSQIETYDDGDFILRRGEVPDRFFIIEAGEAVVTNEKNQTTRTLGDGDYFGEGNIHETIESMVNVVAVGNVECITIHREDFARQVHILSEKETSLSATIFGHAEALLAGITTERGERDEHKDEEMQLATRPFTNISADISAFDLGNVIAEGVFGYVAQATERTSGATYVLKCLHKQLLSEYHREHIALCEIDALLLLRQSGSKFCIRIFGRYNLPNSIFIALECGRGADLWTALHGIEGDKEKRIAQPSNRNEKGGFEKDARTFYMCCTICAVSEVHALDLVHRDIMPENLVVSENGYVKLCDFGTTKKLERHARTHTLCGAAEYCAPEMFTSGSHGREVDFWKLGVLLFEIGACCTPFDDADGTKGVFKKIAEFAGLDDGAKAESINVQIFEGSELELMCSLLQGNPVRRIGAGARGMDEVEEHDSLRSMIGAVRNQKATVPWLPPQTGCFSNVRNSGIMTPPSFVGLQERFEWD